MVGMKDRTVEQAPLVYTVPEAGRLLDLTPSQAYEAAARGDLPTIRIGRRVVVPKAALAELLGE
jgi:excisionase family DNA binding protein